MYRKFEQAIGQLQQRANYKNDELDQRLTVLQNDLEKKENSITELVQRSGLD